MCRCADRCRCSCAISPWAARPANWCFTKTSMEKTAACGRPTLPENKPLMRHLILSLLFVLTLTLPAAAQEAPTEETPPMEEAAPGLRISDLKPLYGIASYYADKFNGRQTANGGIYWSHKLSAACNRVPLGTWIRVTNLRNKRVVIVQVTDRLHPKNKRVVDMSRIAAQRLGYIGLGLTQVKVEILVRRAT
ncbi:MAG: septal ring lytic transglycosylase RlpA family protein [Chitinophagaceae bacterium]|nr:MAG: septal ring lytic transglycosylase RlpA family protein [Chitinophagaceae bacterium]